MLRVIIITLLLSGCASSPVLVNGSPANTPKAGRVLQSAMEQRELTKAERQVLKGLFSNIQSRFTYRSEVQDAWAWQYQEKGEIVGDCDDFAGNFVEGARKLGIPARRVTAYTETGTYHMVAEAGGMIYDNRHNWPMPLNALHYEWVKAETPQGWVFVKEGNSND